MIRVTTVAALAAALFGCSGTLGGKTRDQIREGMTGKQAELQQCYADALGRNRDAAGQVAVALHVKADTKTVDQVDVEESAIEDQEMQACVQRALTGVAIPEAPGQNVQAHFRLDFQPSGDAPAAPAEGTMPVGEAPAEGAEAAAAE